MKYLIILITFIYSSILYASDGKLLDKTVAIVNNQAITMSDLEQFSKLYVSQLINSGDSPTSENDLLKKSLQHLIGQTAALQIANKNNVFISDDSVNQTIKRMAVNGVDKLKKQLESQDVSWSAFRDSIRNQMIVVQLERDALAKQLQVTPDEINSYVKEHKLLSKDRINYKVETLSINIPDNATQEKKNGINIQMKNIYNKLLTKEITFAQAQSDYADSSDVKTINAKNTSLKVINAISQLKLNNYSNPILNGNKVTIYHLIDKDYQNLKQKYVEQYKVAVVELTLNPILTEQVAKDRLNNYISEIKNGKTTFAKVAKYNSTDLQSAADGGNKDWTTLDALDPQIAIHVKSLSVDQISNPFAVGEDKYYIVKLLDKRKYNDTDNYIKQQVAKVIFDKKAQNTVKVWLQNIRNQAYVNIIDADLK